jgi:hypothetical protein
MEATRQQYLTLTLSPFEAGVLKTILGRIEIDDDGDDVDYAATNRAEDALVELTQALNGYDEVDFPTRYYDYGVIVSTTPDA